MSGGTRNIQEEILKGKQQTLGQFIWNGETGQFLGRTGGSWGKIFVFYCIYYGFLAGFFSICMFLFYQTLDTQKQPKYIPGDGGSILKNPSLGYRPRPPSDNIESSLIIYSNDDEKSYTKWTSSIDELVEGIENAKMNYSEKATGDNVKQDCSSDNPPGTEEVCNYDITQFEGSECTKENKWGYTGDSPCVVLKLNRMYGWEPKVFESVTELPGDMPTQLSDHIKSQENNGSIPAVLWVSCEGEGPVDREMLPNGVNYAPTQGFPYYYFPYSNQENYRSPILAVQFVKPTPNIIIDVVCKIWGKEIKYDKKGAIGMVHFELLRESRSGQ